MRKPLFVFNNPVKKSFFQTGLTMIEILIVLGIIGLLAVLFLLSMTNQTGRGRDAKRKDDLKKIQVAFEDYYNDHDCYPPHEALQDCNGSSLAPYLSRVPCDPLTDRPYVYQGLDGSECNGYRILVQLENEDDPAIVKIGCSASGGCGNYSDTSYNYGVSVGEDLSNGSAGWSYIGAGTQVWVCLREVEGPACSNVESSEAQGCGEYYYEQSGDCQAVCYEGSAAICDL